MSFISSRHGRLHYESLGEGTPIVLIHGFTNFGWSWAQQAPLLVHSGYRVILPDLYGHGLSEPARTAMSVGDLTEGVLALLDHLALDRVAVCGLSLGGMVAQQLAIEHPDRVRALVVANSRATFAEPALVEAVSGWITVFEQADGPRKRLQMAWPHMLNEGFRESSAGRAALSAWLQVLGGVPGSSLANVARGMIKFDVRARLAAVRAPTLVLSGEHDKLFPPEQSREIAEGIAGAEFRVIPGAGHISSLDSADQFNALLHAFLQALPHGG